MNVKLEYYSTHKRYIYIFKSLMNFFGYFIIQNSWVIFLAKNIFKTKLYFLVFV